MTRAQQVVRQRGWRFGPEVLISASPFFVAKCSTVARHVRCSAQMRDLLGPSLPAGPTLAANSDALMHGVVSASEFSKFRPAQLNPAGLVDMGVILVL